MIGTRKFPRMARKFPALADFRPKRSSIFARSSKCWQKEKDLPLRALLLLLFHNTVCIFEPNGRSLSIDTSTSTMVKTIISVDPKKLPWEQETPVHNRWHPDIPSVATVEEGEVFRVECIDWTGGQIKNDDNSDDIKNVDLSQV
jgi:hypothetical protein